VQQIPPWPIKRRLPMIGIHLVDLMVNMFLTAVGTFIDIIT
jgi:hypothetical protein